MKSFFRPLVAAAVLLTATAVQAQDKPALNTAPPGSRPVPTPQPIPQPEPASTAPEPAAPAPNAPAPSSNAPVPQPTTDSPSGLNFPGRVESTSGYGGPALTAKKLFIYTNFGLGLSSSYPLNQFSMSVAPALGYRFSDRFSAGPGISYAYGNYWLSDNFLFPSNGKNSVATSSVGLKVFGQFMVYKQFFLHGEYEVTKAEILNQDFSKIQQTISTPLLGAGYRTEFSSNAAADIVILYNFNDGLYSGLYGQPVIRFNFLINIGR